MYYDLGFGDWVYEIDEVTGNDISNSVMKIDADYKTALQLGKSGDIYEQAFVKPVLSLSKGRSRDSFPGIPKHLFGTIPISLFRRLGCLVCNHPQGTCHQTWVCLSRIIWGNGRIQNTGGAGQK
jgi:hypothetical protein